MRPQVVLAMVLVSVLIASAFIMPGVARASPAPASVLAHPAAGLSIFAVDWSGSITHDFYSGLTYGQIGAYVVDTAGDTSATVKLTDQNASRDQIDNPAATWTVNFHGTTNNTASTPGGLYQVPPALTYGGNWTLTVTATTGGTAQINLTVHTYRISTQPQVPGALPAHPVPTAYYVYMNANEAPYPHVTNVVVNGVYRNSAGTIVKFPGSPKSLGNADLGWYNWTVPTDTNGFSYVTLTFYANTTAPSGGPMSESSTFTIYVAQIAQPTVELGACPGGCVQSTFIAGTPVYVAIWTWINVVDVHEPGAGLTVTIKFQRGSSPTTPSGAPTSLTSDYSGDAAFEFIPTIGTFSGSQTNSVVITVSDPLDPSTNSSTTWANFTLVQPYGAPTFAVALDSEEYYSGDTATVHWSFAGANSSSTAGWSVTIWEFTDGGRYVLSWGSVAAGVTQGSVSYSIPSTYTGVLEVVLTASNATEVTAGYASALVHTPQIILTVNEGAYLPGDKIVVTINTEGSVIASCPLWATIEDANGEWLMNGAVSGTTLTINVPSAPPSDYQITVVCETPAGGLVANGTLTIDEAAAIDLSVWVSTVSSYSDGSYQPGESVTVDYSLEARGDYALPKEIALYLYPEGDGYESGLTANSVVVHGGSGSFQWTIPSSAHRGGLWVDVEASLAGASCSSTEQIRCYTYGYLQLIINPSPSVLSYELGAGSGVSVGWLLLLILLIIIVVVLAVMVLRRRKGPGSMKPFQSSSTPSSPSPSPPPAGGEASAPGNPPS